MNDKRWEELKAEIDTPLPPGVSDRGLTWVRSKMLEIERCHLPERVAEILEKTDNDLLLKECCLTSQVLFAIAKALRTGDLSEIEKWVKDA